MNPTVAVVAQGAMGAAFAVMTFLPIRFVHPFRVKRLRSLTVALLALWAVLAIVAVWQELAPPFWVDAGLCVLAIYFLLIGLWPQRMPPSRDRHA